MVLNAEEKFGGKYHVDPSREMVESIMETCNLMDMSPSNGKHTWSNKRIGKNNIKQRLDKFLIQNKIATSFNEIKSKIIHNIALKHKSVVLSLGMFGNLGPVPLRFSSTYNDSE